MCAHSAAPPHEHDLRAFAHAHQFGHAGAQRRQRALGMVAAITLATMLLELAAGWRSVWQVGARSEADRMCRNTKARFNFEPPATELD